MNVLASGLYLSRTDAECVVGGLVRIGIPTKDISLIVSEEACRIHFRKDSGPCHAMWTGRRDAFHGDGLGELSMAFADVVRNLFIPGISLMAAGPLRTSLAIAGTRSKRTFVDALVEMGIGESQARSYVSGLRAGGILVAAPVQHLCANEVQQIISSRSVWMGC